MPRRPWWTGRWILSGWAKKLWQRSWMVSVCSQGWSPTKNMQPALSGGMWVSPRRMVLAVSLSRSSLDTGVRPQARASSRMVASRATTATVRKRGRGRAWKSRWIMGTPSTGVMSLFP